MSLQLIARCGGVRDVEAMLTLMSGRSVEIFAIDKDHVGISFPTVLVDAVGEASVRAALRRVRIYDLYSGVWIEASTDRAPHQIPRISK